MIVIPAIDLMDKKVVRLRQGIARNKKIYSDNPLAVAKHWKKQKAKWLHIVDLDAAFGRGNNLDKIKEIAQGININIQGGGIRSLSYAKNLMNLGVKRVVVSTKAFQDKSFLKMLIRSLSASSVVLSADLKEGRVALEGWKKTRFIDLSKTLCDLASIGLKWLVYTDISRDGMLSGPNYKALEKLKEDTPVNIIASGGVSSLEDIEKLNSVKVWGVIVGKALYEGKFSLSDAIKRIS